MTATAANCPKSVRDEASEVMCCLRESLAEPAFITSSALVLYGKRQGEEDGLTDDLASEASIDKEKG